MNAPPAGGSRRKTTSDWPTTDSSTRVIREEIPVRRFNGMEYSIVQERRVDEFRCDFDYIRRTFGA
jgi:hypothetical protein